ncbi:beta-propeller domain-containing protein [Pendulispora albinea]|uniref:Beta-propeller domain-containing protein n=1 Tax=Pendulispora albinea TaxID=2741071 RepID=A0ABZ2M7P5_9BACT
MHRFASEQELDAYVAEAEAEAAKQGCDKGANGDSYNAGGVPGAGPPNENVTNNQENGVDEGGIVKNIGNYLVVLRKGRLFAADVRDGRAPASSDSVRVARTDALNRGVWYDEMLVKGDLIYVVGYRYAVPGFRGATEIDTFRLTAGKLERLKTMFLESNDYYSGRNYASRMVDGKLLFYMPHLIGRRDAALAYPRLLEMNDEGQVRAVGPLFGALDVTTSLHRPIFPTFHTIVRCELPASGELACDAKSVIGGWWRETYVSTNAVYLWASSHVYRFDFASLDVTTHRANGSPLDQFSFRESRGELLVAVNAESKASLASLPLAAFDKKGLQDVEARALAPGHLATNRFVGDVLVASVSGEGARLVTLDARTGAISSAPAEGIVRVEPLGDRRALVVSRARSGLRLRALSVDDVEHPLGELALEGLTQGEGRSHGFFYKPGAGQAGTFGYAVINEPRSGANWGWGNGISNLGFFDVAPDGALAPLGIVSAGNVASPCETSCVDWYGNTRPIFLRDRAFALMGSELAELSLRPAAARIGAAVVLTSN